MIGSPISHSISPAIQNAAFAACGLDAHYAAVEVAPPTLGDWVRQMRTPDTLGFNVTLPHKITIRAYLDRIEGDAVQAGAVNTVIVESSGEGLRLVGANTDTVGFRRLLQEDGGQTFANQRVLLLGAGGGARAVALVALQDGAASLWVANRHPNRGEELLSDLTGVRRATHTAALSLEGSEVQHRLAEATIVVNATSVGLASDAMPVDLTDVPPGCLVVDLIYNPEQTAFLRTAAQLGARTLGGLGMLVYQAAAAFERWTNMEAPIGVMRSAAQLALAERAQH